MSHLGKKPISIPASVIVTEDGQHLTVSGPKGELSLKLPLHLGFKKDKDSISLSCLSPSRQARCDHGTFRAHLKNMIQGVSEGWAKSLEVVGTGYKAEKNQDQVILNVGFIHPVKITIPAGLDVQVDAGKITINGADKYQVGQLAAKIYDVRRPDSYQGKGVLYSGQKLKLKPGKAAKTAA